MVPTPPFKPPKDEGNLPQKQYYPRYYAPREHLWPLTNPIKICLLHWEYNSKGNFTWTKSDSNSKSSTPFTQTPGVRLVISVIEWFNTFLTLALTHLCRICDFEESRCQFNEPLGVCNSYLTHVLFCCHDELVVDDPVRLSLEKGATWVDINWLILN